MCVGLRYRKVEILQRKLADLSTLGHSATNRNGRSQMITIFGPMIYTALYVMCLMGVNPLQGPFEGMGPETARAKRELFGPKKVETFMAQPFKRPA